MPYARRDLARVSALSVLMVLCGTQASSQAQSQAGVDPVGSHLLAMGKPGASIAVAREKVLAILQSENSCSAWFREADPNAAEIFSSLEFALDRDGPGSISGLMSNSGGMLFKQPYSARVREYAGRHAVITLNANGPFFRDASPVLRQRGIGSSLAPSGWAVLKVGTYEGNTLRAQMTTLLHELGHVVGRLPEDFDELSGQSSRNTAQVLRFCRAEIKRSTRKGRHPEM